MVGSEGKGDIDVIRITRKLANQRILDVDACSSDGGGRKPI